MAKMCSPTAFNGTYVITHYTAWYSLVRWSVGSDCFFTTTEPLQSSFSIEPRPPRSGDLGPIVLALIRARLPCSHMPKQTELRGETHQVPKQRARCESTLSWHLQMARRIVFTDSGFWKYSWAHLVMSMTESCRWVMQCCLRARRPRATNKGLRPCPLCTEISTVSLNLLMLCTADDEICKAFAIWRWRTLFLKYSTIFLRTLSQIGEPLPIFTSERLCLSKTSLL